MTWLQWINSKYNTLGLYTDGEYTIKEDMKTLVNESTVTTISINSEVDPNITYVIYDFNNYIGQ